MIPKGFKPMLASPVDSKHPLQFPLFASPKLDGVRAIVFGGVVYSRNLKPIPNSHVQTLFGLAELEGMDGELIVGEPNAENVFTKTMGGVMSMTGQPAVVFHVFDRYHTGSYEKRRQVVFTDAYPSLCEVPQYLVGTQARLDDFERQAVALGYEGLMVRSLDGPYKCGRSTAREGLLLKIKRFSDAEALVVGVEELQHNGNNKDASGKRTSHKAGKSGRGMLGALIVKGLNGPFKDAEFNIGTGFTEQQRIDFWECAPTGLIVKYKFFELGAKDAPRFPVFLGIRDKLDMPKQ